MNDRAGPRLVIAVNPFKETIPGTTVAGICARAAERAGFTPVVVAASDGGDGLLDALRAARVTSRETRHTVPGPTGSPVSVPVGWLEGGGPVVESRLVVGLGRVPPAERDPGALTTRGLGLLLRELAAASSGPIHVGLGGSATMDGGLGMAVGLGWDARAADGAPVELGRDLGRLARLDPGPPLGVPVVGLIDVENPLLGDDGARVYARQKGADAVGEAALERGLAHLVEVLGPEASPVAAEPGAGAAGGLGFGLRWFAGASLESGVGWVLSRTGFGERLEGAAAVLTAEGAFDHTSLTGKLPGAVLRAAGDRGLPAGLLAPRAEAVPAGVAVETGGGQWDEAELARRAERLVMRLRRLLGA